MYKEVDRRTAIDLYLEDATVYAIDPSDLDDNQYMSLQPLEDCYIQDLKSSDIRYLADIEEEAPEAESKEDTPSPEPEDVPEISQKPKKENKKPGPKTQPVDVGKIRALHNAGWSQGAIASEMGISVPTVRKYLDQIDQMEGGNEDAT